VPVRSKPQDRAPPVTAAWALAVVVATAAGPRACRTEGAAVDTLATSRRGFVNLLLGSGVGAMLVSVLYPVVRYLIPPKSGEPTTANVTIPWKPTEIRVNAGRIFRFGSQPGLLIRTPAGELRAFSAVCTHLNCTVQYREGKQDIWCACHDGVYDLHGKNVSGPPPRPLEDYRVQVKGEQIVVSKRA
jgi:Rieske Fe-S protein